MPTLINANPSHTITRLRDFSCRSHICYRLERTSFATPLPHTHATSRITHNPSLPENQRAPRSNDSLSFHPSILQDALRIFLSMATNYSSCFSACAAATVPSGLDTAAAVMSILTFVYAVLAGIFVRAAYVAGLEGKKRDAKTSAESLRNRLESLDSMDFPRQMAGHNRAIYMAIRPLFDRADKLFREVMPLRPRRGSVFSVRARHTWLFRFLGFAAWFGGSDQITKQIEDLHRAVTDTQSDIVME